MQFTAVFIKNHIIGNEKGSMSLNDVCCYIPAWFGAIASILTGLIAYECSLGCNTDTQILKMVWGVLSGISGSGSGSDNSNDSDNNVTPASENEKVKKSRTAVICGVFATGIMSIVPAHMMRSVGGGFDNESIAVSTMMLTFYFWVRSLRGGEKYSWLFGILTGIAYFYVSFFVVFVRILGYHILNQYAM
jgi:dolichyl-diphosphooligosaccharide--protein glycosyltransferase